MQNPIAIDNSHAQRGHCQFKCAMKHIQQDKCQTKHSLDNLNANKQKVVGFVLRVLGLQPSNA